jgi:putative addiction module antidote
MQAVKVSRFGNSAGITLTKAILEKLRVSIGDTVYVHETKNGIEVTPYNEQFAAQMEIAEQIMREDRDVLRRLAE